MMVAVAEVAPLLRDNHYLGAATRGTAYRDTTGVLVFANPSSRRLPQARWLDLTRWCILRKHGRNAGSQQWARVHRWLLDEFPQCTTIVSYSDPSVGHCGALYRACNWLWALTWHRLRPPPSGNGDWGTGPQAVKDRWVFPLKPDDERASLLELRDESLRRRFPWAEYREPTWKRGRPRGGGGDFKRWMQPAERTKAVPA